MKYGLGGQNIDLLYTKIYRLLQKTSDRQFGCEYVITFFNYMKRKYTDSQWALKLEREKKDFFQALRTQKSIVEGKGLTVNVKGRYETPKSDFVVNQNDGSWLKFDEKRKNGKRIYINKINKQLSKYLYAFASFLRKDGIDDKDVIKYYLIHLLCYNVKFFYKLKVEFKKTEPLIDDIVNWAMKKDTSKVKAGNLIIDTRKMVAPENITVTDEKTGLVSIKKLNKGEKISLLNEARGLLTEKKIKKLYNPDLTDKENCEIIGVDKSTLRRWKKKQKDNGSLESKEEKIKRLYNPNLSQKENCKIIGCSKNTLKKYITVVKDEKIEPSHEVEVNDILIEEDDSWVDDLLNEEDF